MKTKQTYDAIIIGAGIQGCSTAYHLARRHWRVLLLEKGIAGRQASGVNAGGVRRLFRDPAELELSVAAMEMWPQLEKNLGFPLGFRANGQVRLAESEAEMQLLEQRAAQVRSLGYTHEEVMDARTVKALIPEIAPHCLGGLISRHDGSAEPYLSTRAFLLAARKAGTVYMEKSGVTALEKVAQTWEVHCDTATFQTPVLVNCAGAWGGKLARQAGDSIPITPEAPTMMVTARVKPFLKPVVGLAGRKLSFKQMPNGTVVIGGGHRSALNFSKETTQIDFHELQTSAQTVIELFPAMKNVQVVRCWAGIEGMLPDHLPAIGPSRHVSGLYHACGFSAHGFQLGPIVGRVISDLLVRGSTQFSLAAFDPGRFEQPKQSIA